MIINFHLCNNFDLNLNILAYVKFGKFTDNFVCLWWNTASFEILRENNFLPSTEIYFRESVFKFVLWQIFSKFLQHKFQGKLSAKFCKEDMGFGRDNIHG